MVVNEYISLSSKKCRTVSRYLESGSLEGSSPLHKRFIDYLLCCLFRSNTFCSMEECAWESSLPVHYQRGLRSLSHLSSNLKSTIVTWTVPVDRKHVP